MGDKGGLDPALLNNPQILHAVLDTYCICCDRWEPQWSLSIPVNSPQIVKVDLLADVMYDILIYYSGWG